MLLCLPLVFWACGDDSSSPVRDNSNRVIPSEVEGSVDYVWETADDKVKCKNTRSGKIAYYEPDDAVLICEYDEDSDEWAWTEYVDNGNENADPDIHRGDDEDTESKSSSSTSVIPSDVEGSSSSVASSSSAKSSSSASSSDSGWTWDVPKEARLNPEITYGTMTDARDGKKYKTVEICNKDKSLCQTWMAENLNFNSNFLPKGKTAATDSVINSWCYDDNEAYCDVAGRLYTWAAAIDSAALANDADDLQTCGYGKTCDRLTTSALAEASMQGVCPSGWHLPSREEWNALFTAVGEDHAGTALKTATGWYSQTGGVADRDAYGFSALPAGGRYYGDFNGAGNLANFWSSSESDRYSAYVMRLCYFNDYADLLYFNKRIGYSVRCFQN